MSDPTPENIGPIVDPTVTISATPSLTQYISSKKELKEIKESLSKNPFVRADDLKTVHKCLLAESSDDLLRGNKLDKALEEMLAKGEKFTEVKQGPYLHEMVEGGDLQLPKNPVIPRNPALQARIERLKHQQAEVAYRAMTKDVASGKYRPEDSVAYQLNMMNRQLIAVGQVVLSVGAGFAFGFFGVPMAVGGLEFGVRALLGLLMAVIVAVAELYFLAKYMTFEDTEQDKKESKHLHQD